MTSTVVLPVIADFLNKIIMTLHLGDTMKSLCGEIKINHVKGSVTAFLATFL
jgi:hypothetical protein